MSALDDIKADLARINAATTDIADDIKALKDKIGTGLSDAEVAALKSDLDDIATKLEAVAAGQ